MKIDKIVLKTKSGKKIKLSVDELRELQNELNEVVIPSEKDVKKTDVVDFSDIFNQPLPYTPEPWKYPEKYERKLFPYDIITKPHTDNHSILCGVTSS